MEQNKEDILKSKWNPRYAIPMPFGYEAIYEAMEEYAQQFKDKHDELARWKHEAQLVMNPILDYGQAHSDIKPGQSISKFVIQRCKQYDQAKDLLEEAALQIEYLQHKFHETGTGNNVLSRIKSFLDGTE